MSSTTHKVVLYIEVDDALVPPSEWDWQHLLDGAADDDVPQPAYLGASSEEIKHADKWH